MVKDYGDLPAIECYGSQLNQVFMNVLVNAIQAIAGEGTLTLTTRLVDEARVEISIRDTGCGMSDEVRKKIFDPFFSTKPVGEGSGLGLSISHGIVEDHGGSITAESQPGEGTEIKITLPTRAAGMVRSPSPQADSPSPA